MAEANSLEGASPETRRLRVATWNMDHWKRKSRTREAAWAFLADPLAIDGALLQECVPPKSAAPSRVVYRQIGGGRPWGSAVAAFRDDLPVEEVDSVRTRWGPHKFSVRSHVPGALMVARTKVPEVGPVTFVSLYSTADVYYSQTTVLRFVADLIPLFDSPEGERVILGGDFNLTTSVSPSLPELPRYEAILSALKSLGLENVAETAEKRPPPPEDCPCGASPCSHLTTYGEGLGPQLDWLFATPELARRCRHLRVEWDRTRDLSDHAPIVAEFELPVRAPDREWDPDSFVQEMGIRSGPAAGRVAAEIVAWARRKHEGLQRQGKTYASLGWLPTSSGEVPALWVQIDLEGQAAPGYTVSMTTAGRLTVQFQYMQFRPFDTQDGRRKLWSRLKEMPGAVLEARLTGRPWFPVAVLDDGDNLQRFLGILDWTVDEVVGSFTG